MSEDRFRFPDFFTLREKIKVIRSREWIRYVKEDLMKRILEGLPRQTACDLTLLEQTIERIVVQKQVGLNVCFKNGRSILIPKKEGR